MWPSSPRPTIQYMERTREFVLELAMTITDQRPITGTVQTRDGHVHAFSGWSELFAALQTLTAEAEDGGESSACT